MEAGVDEQDAALTARKVALRRAVRAARAELSVQARRTASAAATDRLRTLPELRRARSVLVYAAGEVELDLAALLEALRRRGVTLWFPRVAGDELEVVATPDPASLVPGFRGLHEPTGRGGDVDDLDAILTPGVAFDPTGGRLGQGGGHYDRLLARAPYDTLRVGVGFACQLVPRVPRTHHDEPVDVVVTDRATYRTGARHEDVPS